MIQIFVEYYKSFAICIVCGLSVISGTCVAAELKVVRRRLRC